jgi:BirA family biotin operon repressor/biotin-[acetyl-CoA-carboxylase] ligase
MNVTPFFTILDSVDSTNNYAMEQVQQGLARHGNAWFALEQTSGKGQRGKTWVSEKEKNIAMSLVFEPGRLPAGPNGAIISQFHFSAAVALTCTEFLLRYIDSEIKIKWPNDLFWRDRKAGGILIENKFQGNVWKWAVVGIGININQTGFYTDLVNPVSLKQITGKTFNVIELAKELHLLLLKNLAQDTDPQKIMEQYNRQLYKINELVTLRKDGVEFDTVIKEVSNTGRLITVDAIEREFEFGEVEWVL